MRFTVIETKRGERSEDALTWLHSRRLGNVTTHLSWFRKPQVSPVGLFSIALGWAGLVVPGPTDAQQRERPFAPQPIFITGQPCNTCKIAATRFATIGSAADPGTIRESPLPSVALDGRGRVVVSGSDGLPQLWTINGGFEGKIGRLGSGPGEFDTPPYAVFSGRADSLWFVHGPRVSIFSAEGRFGRTFKTEMILIAPQPLPDGRILFSGVSTTPERAGFQLHTMDGRGSLGNSFVLVPPGGTWDRLFLIPFGSVSASGEFWARNANTYALFKLGLDGTPRGAFQRNASWFTTIGNRRTDSTEPTAQLVDAKIEGGHAWTLCRSASRDWQRYAPGAARGGAEGRVSAIEYDKLFETVVEILDLESKQVLADIRLPGYPLGFLGAGYLATLENDSNDIPRIQVWKLQSRGAVQRIQQ